MRGFNKAALMLGLVATFSAPAWAQGRPGGPGGGMMMGGRGGVAMLVGNASVQKELKLEADQVEKAKGVSEELRGKMREAMESTSDLEGPERMKKMQEISWTTNEEGFKALGTFMKPEQVKRLKEITLQQQGPNALTYAPIAKKLNVTNEQTGKVAAILAEERTEMREAMQEEGGDRMAAMAKIRKQTAEKVLAVMTETQQREWKEMLGEPFEVKMEGGPGGPGGGRARRKGNDN